MFAAFVPLGVVTTTLALPALPLPVLHVMLVLLTTVKLATGVPPKVTLLAPMKFVPVIVTLVPPELGPLEGETPVTVGAVW